MPRGALSHIRSMLSGGSYDMTIHASEEMAGDHLDLVDIETAILTGKIVKSARDQMGRVRYTIQGNAADETSSVAIIGRFTESGRFLIITCYRVAEPES